jgi:hypothetical protein
MQPTHIMLHVDKLLLLLRDGFLACAAARTARGTFSSVLNCTLPGAEMKTPVPADAPSEIFKTGTNLNVC